MEFFSEHTELSTERAIREGRTNSERRESGVIPRKLSESQIRGLRRFKRLEQVQVIRTC